MPRLSQAVSKSPPSTSFKLSEMTGYFPPHTVLSLRKYQAPRTGTHPPRFKKKGFEHIHVQTFPETPGPGEKVHGSFRSQELRDKSRFIHVIVISQFKIPKKFNPYWKCISFPPCGNPPPCSEKTITAFQYIQYIIPPYAFTIQITPEVPKES